MSRRYDRRDIMFPGCSSFRQSFRPSRLRGTTLRAAPSKSYAFSAIIMHELQWQHDLDVYLLFCFHIDLHIASSRGCV